MSLTAKKVPMSRLDEIEQFVASAGYAGAPVTLLAGDASFRKYWRVSTADGSLVVMDAPPEHENIAPFIQVTELLLTLGLRAPKIHAHDHDRGFLLLEDLGDNLYSKALLKHPADEAAMYRQACEALSVLHRESGKHKAVATSLPRYDEAVYLREVALLAEWFLVQVHGQEIARGLRDEWLDIWRGVLRNAAPEQNVLVHRDYHADNLLWLDDTGITRVGMLDYQDALLGDALYDVISLLEDARRDVSPETVEACKAFMLNDCGATKDRFSVRYHVLAAQRNSKIIGIFTRLCVRDGKARYLDFMPRVWGHLLRDIEHPTLAPVKQFIDAHVPLAYRGVFEADVTRGGIVIV